MKTLFDKVWDSHLVAQEEDETLLYVDRSKTKNDG